MKKILIITTNIIIIVLLVVIIAFQHSNIKALQNNVSMLLTNNNTTMYYDDFSIKINDIEQLTDKEFSGVVYFGRDTCPYCSEFNKLIKQSELFNNIKIYKFDTDTWRKNQKFNDILKIYNIEEIPVLIKIENGKISARFDYDSGLKYQEQIKLLKKFTK